MPTQFSNSTREGLCVDCRRLRGLAEIEYLVLKDSKSHAELAKEDFVARAVDLFLGGWVIWIVEHRLIEAASSNAAKTTAVRARIAP
jgi:hypothetical protein